MPQIYFRRLDELDINLNNKITRVWKIQLEETNEEYFIPAQRVHTTLQRGRYWSDSKHLIEIPEESYTEVVDTTAGIYLQIECGHCEQISLVRIEPPANGSHSCVRCGGTICIVTGNQVVLKYGSKARNTQVR